SRFGKAMQSLSLRHTTRKNLTAKLTASQQHTFVEPESESNRTPHWRCLIAEHLTNSHRKQQDSLARLKAKHHLEDRLNHPPAESRRKRKHALGCCSGFRSRREKNCKKLRRDLQRSQQSRTRR